jgi:hypothetical protein
MLRSDAYGLSFVEFCYWLQGAIEIGGLTTFTPEQAALIRHVSRNARERNGFLIGIGFALSHLSPGEAFVPINEDLQAMFLHEIDPTYEGDQEHLLAVHRGETEPVFQGKNGNE